MNDLQKMQESCKEFANDLKTGNVTWENKPHDYFAFAFKVKTNLGEISLFYDNRFFYTFADKSIYLKSTTAKEAANEALQLVKNEAQKLVDALSEPKQGNTVEKFIKKAKAQMEAKIDKEPFWIPIDKDNLPKGDVLAVTRVGYTITGEMSYDKSINVLRCTCVKDKWELSNVTHYHDILKYPKP